MKNHGRFAVLLLAALIAFTPFWAEAMPYRAPQPLLSGGIRPIAAEIGQQLQDLVGGAPLDIEPQETFGTRALGFFLNAFKAVSDQGTVAFADFAGWSQFASWLAQQVADPLARTRWADVGALILLVLPGALLAGWLADFLLASLRRRIYLARFRSLGSKAGAVFGWLVISLIPVVLFVSVALAVIAAQEPTRLARYVVMTVVYALALLRLLRVFSRFFLSPRIPSLRFLPIPDDAALTIQNWVMAFGAVMVAGFFGTEIARTVKVPAVVVASFTELVALIVVVMALAVIVRKRAPISAFIRGDVTSADAHRSVVAGLRLWLSRTWHVMAALYLIVAYMVAVWGQEGGFALMQQGTIGTLLSLLTVRLAFYWIGKIAYRRSQKMVQAGLYRPVLRVILKVAAWGLGFAGIMASWGGDVASLLATPWGQRISGSVFSITSTILIVVFIYELLQKVIERSLNKRDSHGRVVEAGARSRTILPMAQKAATVVLVVIVGLVTLAELGINIAPLLAGAGVLGVAVGFGSQTLVKDFLTGLSIILEDTIAVGDWITISDKRGLVETLSVRTVHLRDMNGALHVIPYSAITTITNETKTFSYALMDVGVAYDSDLDLVMDVVRKTGEALQADPEFAPFVLEPIEVLGVETLGSSAIEIRSRIKTRAGRQGAIRRAFLLRIKKAFDAAKIEIPFPTVKHITAT